MLYILVSAIEECNNYTEHTEAWRKYSFNSTIEDNSTSCDATFLKHGWHRFTGAAGTQLYSQCTYSGYRCGTRSPGWLLGSHPSSPVDGVVNKYVRYYTYYCADGHAEIKIRNCGNFFVYNFHDLPYWSCNFGLCTI